MSKSKPLFTFLSIKDLVIYTYGTRYHSIGVHNDRDYDSTMLKYKISIGYAGFIRAIKPYTKNYK